MQTSKSSETLFWEKVNKTDNCWLWIGCKNSKGYGGLTANRKWMRAHRFSWILHNGRIPRDLHVCHKCDNPSCVRPDHLYLGTNHDNVLDCHVKNRHAIFVGALSSMAKLTWDIVQEMKLMTQNGVTYTDIAKQFGVNRTTVSRAVNGTTWNRNIIVNRLKGTPENELEEYAPTV